VKVPTWLGVLIGLLLVVFVVAVLLYLVRGQVPLPGAPPTAGPTAARPYQVYFTEPTYPDRTENRRGGIDERFVELVDASQRTLDVAAYDFDLENVALAMARAKSRGVTVRMVTDSDTINNTRDQAIQKALSIVSSAGIEIVPDERQAIMHHKFAVRDGEEVWTGSWNLTTGDTYRLNNNAARIRSAELALAFKNEFEQMFVRRTFGGSKAKGTFPAPIAVGDARVQPLFSPGDGVATRIADRVSQARSSVLFMAFSFTHDAIGRAVLDRAQAGVDVHGVFETTGSNTRFSEFGAMKEAGLDVYQDGNPYVMHHKVFVVDDRTVIFGSFNFSESADRENDENCLIVDDPVLAAEFRQEFDRVLRVAKNPVRRGGVPSAYARGSSQTRSWLVQLAGL
jgi:phosphatidylserine/phosphatidylglycerophosphate/cardiolipin synthase-like enzyme